MIKVIWKLILNLLYAESKICISQWQLWKLNNQKCYLMSVSTLYNVVNIHMWSILPVCSTNDTQAKASCMLDLNGLQFSWMVKCRRRTCGMPVSWQPRIICDLWGNTLLLYSKVSTAIIFRGSLWRVGITIEVTSIQWSACWRREFLKAGIVCRGFMCPY